MIRLKRGLAILLSICMIGGMMPLPANAEETGSQNTVSDNTVQTENAGQTENVGQTENAVTVTDIAVDTSAASQTLDHYDANGFCRGYEIDPDGSGAWVKKSGDDACTDENCNGYQPMTTVTEAGTEWYEISNAGQLYWFADQADNGNLLDANVRLTADIVDNEGVTFGWDENNDYAVVATKDGQTVDAKTLREWNPIGGYVNKQRNYFSGHFDGQGHVVSGLYFSGNKTGQAGIFSIVSGSSEDNQAIVEKVGLENSYLHGKNQAGGIVGTIQNATIRKCYNAAYLLASMYVGGISAVTGESNHSANLVELYNVGEMKIVGDSSKIGQIIGEEETGTSINIIQLSSCYGRSDLSISLVGEYLLMI